MSSVVIKKVETNEIDKLFEFRESIYTSGSQALNFDLWKWKFYDKASGEYNFYVIKNGADIVGSQGFIKASACIRNSILRVIFLVDFYVHEKFRGLPAIQLFKRVCSEGEIQIGVNNSKDVERLFKSANWIDKTDRLKNLYYYSDYQYDSTFGRFKFYLKKNYYKLKIKRDINTDNINITHYNYI